MFLADDDPVVEVVVDRLIVMMEAKEMFWSVVAEVCRAYWVESLGSSVICIPVLCRGSLVMRV